jgi:transcriptional regulator of heat shock response
MIITLTERQERILALVVHDYVETAQPVGSMVLVRRHGLPVSSATVRNELAMLEDLGYLQQPYTSAGRVPTVVGYRYFVEHLMLRAELSESERRTIRHQFHQAGHDPERWLRLSAAVMAKRSGLAALVTGTGPDAVPRYHAGLTQILYQPEFADSDRLCSVVELLEHGHGLESIIDRLPQRGVQIIIGGEPPLKHVAFLTLVLARFGPDDSQGVLGVVGPTRMAYERAVPAVGFMSRLMSHLMTGEAV